MNVEVKLKYTLNDILKEFDCDNSKSIIQLKQNDKFFVGRGCEIPYIDDMSDEFKSDRGFMIKAYDDSMRHYSICTDNVMV